MRLGWLAACAALLATVVIGCSHKPKPKPGAPAVRGTDEQIFVGDTIEKNYDPNVIMKRAEAFFDQEEYAEAIIEYQHFLDLHRVHTLASYAQFKLAESHFKMFKTIDRDPEPIYKAIEHYEKLLKTYPGSRYETDAAEKIRSGHNFLAQIHFMIGEFYYRREAYLSAAHRFEYVVTQYPDMGVAADALYHLVLTYHAMRADDWAQEKLAALAERYPNSKYTAGVRVLLAQLGAAPSTEVAGLPEAEPADQNGHGGQVLAGLEAQAGAEPVIAAASIRPNASSPAWVKTAYTLPETGQVGQNGHSGQVLASSSPWWQFWRRNGAGQNSHSGQVLASLEAQASAEPVVAPANTPSGSNAAPQYVLCRLGVRC